MRIFAYRSVVACAACLWAAPGWAVSVLYDDPVGGWLYSYEGSGTAYGNGVGFSDSLDGTWVRGGSSDSWDGSGLGGVFSGTNQPGGIESLPDGEVTYLRIQDTGDPRSQGTALGYPVADPTNRKIYLIHPLALPNDALETGLTFAFRIRVATTGPLDPQYPSTVGLAGENNTVPGGTAWSPNGCLNADDGKGFIGLHGAISGSVSFSPGTPNDRYNDGTLFGTNALVTNNLNGTVPSRNVDPWSLEGGTTNTLPLGDWSAWHEWWITIAGDTTGGGTHRVEIYADGGFAPVRFDITVGTGNEGNAAAAQTYLAMGFHNSAQMGAVDVDYVAVKAGIFAPVPEPGGGALLASAVLAVSRRPRRAQFFVR